MACESSCNEIGEQFRQPVKTYSAGMRARLIFALSMAVDFDCYLIDEVIAAGDARFAERCGPSPRRTLPVPQERPRRTSPRSGLFGGGRRGARRPWPRATC